MKQNQLKIDQYQPMQDFILLKLETRDTTDGGIHLTKEKAFRYMLVEKVGPSFDADKHHFDVGDVVLLGEAPTMSIELSGQKYLQVPPYAVVGKVSVDINELIKPALIKNLD